MGENICKLSNWQGINHQNAQVAHAACYEKKKKKKIRKWAEDLNRHIQRFWRTLYGHLKAAIIYPPQICSLVPKDSHLSQVQAIFSVSQTPQKVNPSLLT